MADYTVVDKNGNPPQESMTVLYNSGDTIRLPTNQRDGIKHRFVNISTDSKTPTQFLGNGTNIYHPISGDTVADFSLAKSPLSFEIYYSKPNPGSTPVWIIIPNIPDWSYVSVTNADSPFTMYEGMFAFVDTSAGNVTLDVSSLENNSKFRAKKVTPDSNQVIFNDGVRNFESILVSNLEVASSKLRYDEETAEYVEHNNKWQLASSSKIRNYSEVYTGVAVSLPWSIPSVAENIPVEFNDIFGQGQNAFSIDGNYVLTALVDFSVEIELFVLLEKVYAANNDAIQLVLDSVSTAGFQLLPTRNIGAPTSSRADTFLDSIYWKGYATFAAGQTIAWQMAGTYVGGSSATVEEIAIMYRFS